MAGVGCCTNPHQQQHHCAGICNGCRLYGADALQMHCSCSNNNSCMSPMHGHTRNNRGPCTRPPAWGAGEPPIARCARGGRVVPGVCATLLQANCRNSCAACAWRPAQRPKRAPPRVQRVHTSQEPPLSRWKRACSPHEGVVHHAHGAACTCHAKPSQAASRPKNNARPGTHIHHTPQGTRIPSLGAIHQGYSQGHKKNPS